MNQKATERPGEAVDYRPPPLKRTIKGAELEKLLYDQVTERIKLVEDAIQRQGSVVERVRPADFVILVGSLIFFTLLWGFVVATAASIVGSILLSGVLAWTGKAIWKILKE